MDGGKEHVPQVRLKDDMNSRRQWDEMRLNNEHYKDMRLNDNHYAGNVHMMTTTTRCWT